MKIDIIIWLMSIIVIGIVMIETCFSNALPEYKVTWLLIELLISLFSYKCLGDVK